MRAMAAARIIYPPMSGRDRRHFSRELRKGEQEHARLVREAEAAYAAADRQLADAHRLDCLPGRRDCSSAGLMNRHQRSPTPCTAGFPYSRRNTGTVPIAR